MFAASSPLKALKARKEGQAQLDSLKAAFPEITEEMVLKYLSATQGSVIDRADPLAQKKIVDLYVHEVKVFNDRVDVVLKVTLGADKDGVGGGT